MGVAGRRSYSWRSQGCGQHGIPSTTIRLVGRIYSEDTSQPLPTPSESQLRGLSCAATLLSTMAVERGADEDSRRGCRQCAADGGPFIPPHNSKTPQTPPPDPRPPRPPRQCLRPPSSLSIISPRHLCSFFSRPLRLVPLLSTSSQRYTMPTFVFEDPFVLSPPPIAKQLSLTPARCRSSSSPVCSTSLPPLNINAASRPTRLPVLSPPLHSRSRSSPYEPLPPLLMRRPSLTSSAPLPLLTLAAREPRGRRSQSFSVFEERVEAEARERRQRRLRKGRPSPLLPLGNGAQSRGRGGEEEEVEELSAGWEGESAAVPVVLSPILEQPAFDFSLTSLQLLVSP